MPLERKAIEKSLPKKGFVIVEQSKHLYFHHEIKGKRTGMYTYLSRGSGYNTINDSLLNLMKRQLELNSSRQLRDLVECPMSSDDYVGLLRSKGLLDDPPPSKEGSTT